MKEKLFTKDEAGYSWFHVIITEAVIWSTILILYIFFN